MKNARILFPFVSLLFIFLLTTNTGYAKIDEENTVGIWLLDEGKGDVAIDSSINALDGKVTGLLKWEDGKFGDAVTLSSGIKIEVLDNDLLNFELNSFSVVIWINFKSAQDWNRIVRERTPGAWGAGNPGWELQTQGVSIHWSLDDAKSNHQKNTYDNIGDGEWHHTAMIVDRDKKLMYSYLDGENEKSVNIANIGTVTTELPVVIGDGFIGQVDEVGIFSGIIDQDDVVSIMENGLAEALNSGQAVQAQDKSTTTWGKIKDF